GGLLIRFGQMRLAELLQDNGTLLRRLTSTDYLRLGQPEPKEFPLQLARDLTMEDVAHLTRENLGTMSQLGFIRPDSDPLLYRPSTIKGIAFEIDKLFGGTPPDVFSNVRDRLIDKRHDLWSDFVRNLTDELTLRAAAVYPRLILEEMILRTDVIDTTLLTHVQERRALRVAPPDVAASEHHHRKLTPSEERSAMIHF